MGCPASTMEDGTDLRRRSRTGQTTPETRTNKDPDRRVDLSFVSDDESSACAAYVILDVDYPEKTGSDVKAKKK
jgi:hypothetical protein